MIKQTLRQHPKLQTKLKINNKRSLIEDLAIKRWKAYWGRNHAVKTSSSIQVRN